MAENLLSQNLFSLKGKVALITGGGTGLGKMMSKAFVKNGAKVYIASRDQKVLEKTATELNSLEGPGECIPIAADITIKEECEKLANKISERENGNLNILINNSGAGYFVPFTDITEENWDKTFKLNVMAVYFMTMACLPLLKKASNAPEDPSKVIIIGSAFGVYEGDINTDWSSSLMAYNASKAAVHSLARNLAVYLTPSGVNVNVIAPDLIPTDLTAGLDLKKVIENMPQGRVGSEPDIAGTALYLASRAGAWTTGAIIRIDGGNFLHGKEMGKEYSVISNNPK